MANKHLVKRSSVAGRVPVTGELDFGELALNFADGKLYYKDVNGSLQYFVAGEPGSSGGGDTSVAVGTTPPQNAENGDLWWNSEDAILYIYYTDSDSSQWVAASQGGSSSSGTSLTSVSSSIVPTSNEVYDLGSPNLRWRDLYLSGSTINLGGATIKTDATSGAIALLPQPTVENPNPSGVVISPTGGVTVVETTGGELAIGAIEEAAASPTSAPVPIDITTTPPVDGQALIWQSSNSTFVPGNVSGGSGGTPVTVTTTPKFVGALFSLTQSQTVNNTTPAITEFTTVVYDNSPEQSLTSTLSEFTIPAGVSKVRLSASIADPTSVSGQLLAKIEKNGSFESSFSTNMDVESTGGDFAPVFTAVQSVVQGDVFKVRVFADSSRTIDPGEHAWFAIEVVEGSILATTQEVSAPISVSGLMFAEANASGTTVQFSDIPSWARQITFSAANLTFAASSGRAVVRLGSGSLNSTGYLTTAALGTSQARYEDGIANFNTNSTVCAAGSFTLTRIGNTWVSEGTLGRYSDTQTQSVCGQITLSEPIDRIALVATTSSFVSGTVGITYI